jgi:glycosyltransferase involved in cell wall biosynthesis
MPRVALGLTLHNNAPHLPAAAASLLAQSYRDFGLVMLDDASSDETPRIAQALAREDGRIKYVRHHQRAGMIPTWRDVVDIATRDCPSAEYFAWVSDHDWWNPEWLARLVDVLDRDPSVVLAYPMTQRMEPDGTPVEKDLRVFQTVGLPDVGDRWVEFCRRGVGSGDMVYGLMRVSALRAAGIFRDVMNPDRLLIAELTLQGAIAQVQEPLWVRRRSVVASIARQRHTLIAGPRPVWFAWPATLQHAYVIAREYARSPHPPVRIPTVTLAGMLARYQTSSLLRTYRKTDAAKQLDRTREQVTFAAKVSRKHARVLAADAANSIATAWVRLGRHRRKLVYESAFWLRKFASRTRRAQQRARFKVGTALRRVR